MEAVEHFLIANVGNTSTDGSEYEEFTIDKDLFKGMIMEDIELLSKIFRDKLVIPEFRKFTTQLKFIYHQILQTKLKDPGQLASYIPQLARADPNWFGISVCTCDGQRWSIGDTKVPYTVQSTCKPINYALALTEYGNDHVHKYIGKEPSGITFNAIALDRQNKPHNPMINSGAIMSVALLQPERDLADRFDWLQSKYSKLAGKQHV